MTSSGVPDPEQSHARARVKQSRADGDKLVPSRLDDPRDACLADVHALSERLTAITNYLACGVRLSEVAAAGAAMSPRQTEVLEKALGQANQAAEVLHRFRKLLVKESEMQGDKQAVRERAYELWEQGERPDGKELEYWLRAEAGIATEAYAGVTDNGKFAGPSQTELRKRAASG